MGKTVKVKKTSVKDFDFSVPVRIEPTDEVGDLIYELSELSPAQLKRVYKTARQFQKANYQLEQIREELSDEETMDE